MSEPKRIQLSRAKGWRMPENTVKVDRSTGFGNPFRIEKGKSQHLGVVWFVGTWGGPAMWIKYSKEEAAEISIKAFRAWMSDANRIQLAREVLAGKDLACWCSTKPGTPCHADVLLEIANKTPSND